MFAKILIANRGEIAVRIIRALDELRIASVAVYSELDRDAPHVQRAGEAYLIGGPAVAHSYLNAERILAAARRCDADAIHPGYGFLAENAAFARACERAGIVFIGPPASAIEAMGSKPRARELMQAAGVPIVPGTTAPVPDLGAARSIAAADIGYPVAVKAAAGGGGKGLRVALDESELEAAFTGAAREGERFFCDATVYMERYLPDPRHVEVQVLADAHGTTIHLGERDCSVQRRHQKLVEESPAPARIVDGALRARIGQIAVDAAEAVGYRGAGTVEGLLSTDGGAHPPEYFFLEMNTRLQVEHCVTEMTTGVDIVKEAVRVAAGEPLAVKQEDVVLRGHAIECRINAEDASNGFAPAPGRIGAYVEPSGPGVRVDSGVRAGTEVSPHYDPLIAKLIVWDRDREQATRRMLRALGEYQIEGLKTSIGLHRALLASEQWARGETCRDLLRDRAWLAALACQPPAAGAAPLPAAPAAQAAVEQAYTVEVSGRRFDVRVIGPTPAQHANGALPAAPKPPRARRAPRGGSAAGGDALCSPLRGSVRKLPVRQGQHVDEGQVVVIVEAMKMENEITAHKAGVIVELPVAEGDPVAHGETLAVIRDQR